MCTVHTYSNDRYARFPNTKVAMLLEAGILKSDEGYLLVPKGWVDQAHQDDGLGGCIRFDEFFDEFSRNSRNLDLDIWDLDAVGKRKNEFP